ncbi:hypothetical protein [Aestuariibaculum sediminum]|uniref:Uncharacterized protein n=1 Tax=Aestuariibaculum sediminum TaxID=2770637 RepID=A0A8J6U7U2_9FLAO|nr:hypothetical protein [Aestuariibaculum sediminum]MBD0832423.1 hypothetical protein [Aestuariibaculum sediminum]
MDFSGNVVSNPNNISGLIDTSSLPTVVFNIPSNVKSGSFTITVRFCAGVTPNGFSVTNNICASYGGGNSSIENFCSDTGLTSVASAINPWGKITKEPLFPAVFGSDGNYYISTSGGVANYKIRITKDVLYEGAIFGMLNLTNVSISEIALPCASVTLLSGPGVLNSSTNTIVLNNDLNGNIPYEYAEFVIQVDYSGCALTNGQVIPNTVELNGTPLGETPQTNLSNDTANVIAIDNLPGANLSSVLEKSVEVFNPVPGCLGKYVISFSNNDNRPISLVEITDQLPSEIIPKYVSVFGSINSASTSTDFDISFNGGLATTFPLDIGFGGTPSVWSSATTNTVLLKADSNTLLYPNDTVQITIDFIIDSALTTGAIVSNCAHLDGAIIDTPNNVNEILSQDSCIDFTIEDPQVKLCALKRVRKANTNDPFVTDLINTYRRIRI